MGSLLMDSGSEDNWICHANLEDESNWGLYEGGLYFVLTAITTVGYGDIHSFYWGERIVTIMLVFVGVFYYQITQGQIVSLFISYDDACLDMIL